MQSSKYQGKLNPETLGFEMRQAFKLYPRNIALNIADSQAEARRKLQNIKRATNKVHSAITGTLQSAVVGAAAGAAFGPWGIAIGAAIGTIGGIAESAMSTAKEAKIIAIQTAEANSETAKSLQHMGYNGGR